MTAEQFKEDLWQAFLAGSHGCTNPTYVIHEWFEDWYKMRYMDPGPDYDQQARDHFMPDGYPAMDNGPD